MEPSLTGSVFSATVALACTTSGDGRRDVHHGVPGKTEYRAGRVQDGVQQGTVPGWVHTAGQECPTHRGSGMSVTRQVRNVRHSAGH